VPPWINKFYILDLTPEKSFIRWAVAQGHTLFVISWVDPDEHLADKTFEDYMREGVFAAVDAVCDATDEESINAIGYCVGGTVLAVSHACPRLTIVFISDTATCITIWPRDEWKLGVNGSI
jgi:polyhydroxyalkanoate synthase